ncbi:MAG TPA: hypothetical protein VGQ89_17475 [Candidatus Limnocylindrales bacterium]|nr:hypothetical protein [Candidatus Limnocylindrales bacterium]
MTRQRPGHRAVRFTQAALEDFAWLGNQDTPGGPTLWGEPS